MIVTSWPAAGNTNTQLCYVPLIIAVLEGYWEGNTFLFSVIIVFSVSAISMYTNTALMGNDG